MQALTVCTAILAVLLLGERLTAMAVAGEILGLASTMLITLWEELQKPNPLKG
jgi:drug/metabolite transporter (DMT)-like permease